MIFQIRPHVEKIEAKFLSVKDIKEHMEKISF